MLRDYPTLAQLQQVVQAEQERLAGQAQAAAARLRPIVKRDDALVAAHWALMRAERAVSNENGASVQARWLATHRGRVFAESTTTDLLRFFNAAVSAEALRAMPTSGGRKTGGHQVPVTLLRAVGRAHRRYRSPRRCGVAWIVPPGSAMVRGRAGSVRDRADSGGVNRALTQGRVAGKPAVRIGLGWSSEHSPPEARLLHGGPAQRVNARRRWLVWWRRGAMRWGPLGLPSAGRCAPAGRTARPVAADDLVVAEAATGGITGQPQGQGFIAATSWKRAGNSHCRAAREMVTWPDSSGSRSTSSACRPHSGSSSRNSTP